MDEKVLTKDVRKILKESFVQLHDNVRIVVFTKKGENDHYNKFAVGLTAEISELDGRLKAEFYEIGGPESKKYRVERSPTILINPDRYEVRFTGAPAGEEGRSFITAIIMASSGNTVLSKQSKERLKGLREPGDGPAEPKRVRIFTSPT